MPIITTLPAGHRRCFPAWIEADDCVPALDLGARVVLPRVRATLPLRRVLFAASAVTFNPKQCNARRLR